MPLDALANTLIVKQPDAFAQQLGRKHFLSRLQVELTNLTGTLSSALGSLSSLREFNVIFNSFTGTIPSTVGRLTSMEKFLIDEVLSGTMPPQIYKMSALRYLDLSYNELTGTIPEPDVTLPSLETFILSGNMLTGALPKRMDKFPNLLFFSVYKNSLTGVLPSSIGELSNLAFLDASNNHFTGKPMEQPFLYNLTALEMLGIDDNFISGTISTGIGLLTGLIALSVSRLDNQTGSTAGDHEGRLTGTIPTEIGRLTLMDAMLLRGNLLTGSIPTEIGNLGDSLRFLDFSDNELSGTFPTELGMLSKVGMSAFAGICGLRGRRQLTGNFCEITVDLRVHGNAITGSLETFCSARSNKNYSEWDIVLMADCFRDRQLCSCCTSCCEGDQCQDSLP